MVTRERRAELGVLSIVFVAYSGGCVSVSLAEGARERERHAAAGGREKARHIVEYFTDLADIVQHISKTRAARHGSLFLGCQQGILCRKPDRLGRIL